MHMPQPSADHDRLEVLCGDWRGPERMHPSQWDPKGGEAEGHTVCRRALGGFVVIADYEQLRDGARTFEGHGVYTWDAARSEVVLHWFDGIDTGREEFRGKWQGQVLTLSSQGPNGQMRMRYDFSQPGTLSSGMEMSMDGTTWSKLFDGTYRRSD